MFRRNLHGLLRSPDRLRPDPAVDADRKSHIIAERLKQSDRLRPRVDIHIKDGRL